MLRLRTIRVLFFAMLVAASTILPVIEASNPPALQSSGVKVVLAGRLIDGASNTVRTNVSIVIDGDRIREVRDGRAGVEGAEVIDLSDATVMPLWLYSIMFRILSHRQLSARARANSRSKSAVSIAPITSRRPAR